MLVRIKRDQTVAFVGGPHDIAHELAHGRSAVSTVGWENVPSLAEAKGADLRLAHPEPGDFSICDCLCIPVAAPHLDAAYAFIDAMIAADAQATLATALVRGAVAPAAAALIPDGPRGLFGYDDLDKVFAVSPLVGFPTLAPEEDPGIATYVDWVVAWDRIRFTAQLALATPTRTPTPKPTQTPTPFGSPPAATATATGTPTSKTPSIS
jgi:spermidine/putrescine-binding protein